MSKYNYEFAHLSKQHIDQIQQLEQNLIQQTGEEITLIAYAPDEYPTVSDCRPTLDE